MTRGKKPLFGKKQSSHTPPSTITSKKREGSKKVRFLGWVTKKNPEGGDTEGQSSSLFVGENSRRKGGFLRKGRMFPFTAGQFFAWKGGPAVKETEVLMWKKEGLHHGTGLAEKRPKGGKGRGGAKKKGTVFFWS